MDYAYGIDFDVVEVGAELPALSPGPISRLTLALFAGASGDHNPVHVDIDYARAAGKNDVFAHGMLVMAYLGRLLTNWAPPHAIRRFGARFTAITHVHDRLSCHGKIVAKDKTKGENLVTVELSVADEYGELKIVGQATIALPPGVKAGR